jgi:hypothetical protein
VGDETVVDGRDHGATRPKNRARVVLNAAILGRRLKVSRLHEFRIEHHFEHISGRWCVVCILRRFPEHDIEHIIVLTGI